MKNDIQRGDTAIIVGSYTIGKERLFIAAAQHYNCKIYVDSHKYDSLFIAIAFTR